jgi:hypothetical protein
MTLTEMKDVVIEHYDLLGEGDYPESWDDETIIAEFKIITEE